MKTLSDLRILCLLYDRDDVLGDDEISKELTLEYEDVTEALRLLTSRGLITTKRYAWIKPEYGERIEAAITQRGRDFLLPARTG